MKTVTARTMRLTAEEIVRYTEGECCFFALAIRDAFNATVHALVETCKSDGHRNLIHAFCVKGEHEIDANGIHPKGHFKVSDCEGTLFPNEESYFELVTNIKESDFESMREGLYSYDLKDDNNKVSHPELVKRVREVTPFKDTLS